MVILISGRQGSGKTTLAKNLMERLKSQGYDAVPVKFAGPLYQMHDECLKVLSQYGFTRDIVKDGPLLQLLGTEWGRKTLGEDVWVKLAKNRVERVLATGDNKTVVIIDDCRFENEFDAFPEALSIRLECDKEERAARCEAWRENDTHPSETALDDYSLKGKFTAYFTTSKHHTSPAYNADVIVSVYLNKK